MVGIEEQAKNGPWLIKSGDRILGPFSFDEIGKLLRAREIVVIDEVAGPLMRWAYVRDVAAFSPIVDEIRRGQMQAKEDTEVQGYTNTVAVTSSEAPSKLNSATVTEFSFGTPMLGDVTVADSTLVDATIADHTVKLDVQPKTLAMTPKESRDATDSNRKSPLKELGFEPPPPLPLVKTKRRKVPGLFIGGLILVIAAVFVVYTVARRPMAPAVAAVVNTESLQTQASVAWKRGEFDHALELYRAIDRQASGQPAVVTRLALLMMQIEGQTVEAKRLLQSVAEKTKDPEDKAGIEIALGLAALRNDDAKEAISRFNAAGSSTVASYNLGVAYANLKDWDAAIKSFENAGAQPIALLGLARAELSAAEVSSRQANAPALRREAEATIAKGIARFADYKQEMLVVGAYADATSGNKKRAEARALQALQIDPDQTQDHFHDPALSIDAGSWQQLAHLCRLIDSSLESITSHALLGVCLAKTNQLEDASKVIETELAREPGNSLLHSANAYLHMTADRDDAARASLTLATKSGSTRLAQILSSRLCGRERQDVCADEGWSKLASETDPPIAAYTGLAALKFQKGDAATGNALLVNAEKISPTYLPLLRLREDASR